MSYVIFYFSGTGNTELIATEIATRLEKAQQPVELVSIEDSKQLEQINFKHKIIGFGYPIYKFSYPDILDKILPKINQFADKNYYFQFSTYARFEANAFSDFANQLDPNNFKLIAQKSFKSPSCGISARKPIDDYDYKSVMFFENDIKLKLDEFVSCILKKDKMNIQLKHGSPLHNITKRIVNDIEITKYPKLTINQEKCFSCNLCVKQCPDLNLANATTHIKVIDDVGCLHCLRCMNHCPANAITFGQLTEGCNQYTLKTRNQLYKKAFDGYQEPYWDIFPKIIRKWKFHTMRYWITHKYRKIN